MRANGNPLTDYSPALEHFEAEQQFNIQPGGVFDEIQEMELASGLLEISSEEELEAFLGDLIGRAGKAVGGIIQSPVGQAIGGVLKGAAKVALPVAGGALGAYVGGPVGMQIGSSLGSMAGQALGLELEGLSPEDREFEAARQFVRFAGDTVKNALAAPSGVAPAIIARSAAAEAAGDHAPGLLNQDPAGVRRNKGTWVRRGHTIELFGV